MWALAVLGHEPRSKLLAAVAERAVDTAEGFRAPDVVNMLWAYARWHRSFAQSGGAPGSTGGGGGGGGGASNEFNSFNSNSHVRYFFARYPEVIITGGERLNKNGRVKAGFRVQGFKSGV